MAKDSAPDETIEDGGAGSGNFGHKGRPGEVGGSGKGGGKQFRAKTQTGAYAGVDKVKSLRAAKTVARTSKSASSFIEELDTIGNSKARYAICKQFCDVYGYEYDTTSERSDYETAEDVAYNHRDELESYMTNWYEMMHDKKEVSRVNRPAAGKDISGSFEVEEGFNKRAFGAGIDQVIEAQGFNGVPKLVSSSEFDRILEKNPQMPLMMRSYNSDSEEILKGYDKALESGEWYVDCEKGGSLWGAGMYTGAVTHASDAVDKDGVPYRALIDEMYAYRGQNTLARRFGTSNVSGNHATRRMTMMPDAKIINQTDLALMALEDMTGEKDPNKLALNLFSSGSTYYDALAEVEKEKGYEGDFNETDQAIVDIIKNNGNDIDGLREEDIKSAAEKIKRSAISELRTVVMDSFVKGEDGIYDRIVDPYSRYYRRFMADMSGVIEDAVYEKCNEEIISVRLDAQSTREMMDIAMGYVKTAAANDPDVKGLIDKLKSGDHEKVRSALRRMTSNAENYYPYEDQCVWAASMGYDAVNTNNHDDGTSDIIVLNRTKVILDKNYVEL